MKFRERITVTPMSGMGKPVIKGTRVPVDVVLGALAGGMSVEEVCRGIRSGEGGRPSSPGLRQRSNFRGRNQIVESVILWVRRKTMLQIGLKFLNGF